MPPSQLRTILKKLGATHAVPVHTMCAGREYNLQVARAIECATAVPLVRLLPRKHLGCVQLDTLLLQ